MKAAAANLEFEKAALLRDQILWSCAKQLERPKTGTCRVGSACGKKGTAAGHIEELHRDTQRGRDTQRQMARMQHQLDEHGLPYVDRLADFGAIRRLGVTRS